MQTRLLTGTGLLAVALLAMPAFAQTPVKAPTLVNLDFKADVRADGVPINIVPDASLAPQLQAMVRKRVAQWHYAAPVWQGKPVPAEVSQRIVAEVVPVASGGFALRIKDVNLPSVTMDPKTVAERKMYPPVYPRDLQRRGVGGVLVYTYRLDAEGKPHDIELVDPETRSPDVKLLDAAAREAMARWTMPPAKVDGVATDCRVLTPITFSVGDRASDRALSKSGLDANDYRASHPDVCPGSPILLTEVAGSLL